MRPITITSALVLLLAISPTRADLIVDNSHWLQPKDYVFTTWNEINAVCPGGTCSGSLDGTDLNGFTWASALQMGQFFSTLSSHPGGLANVIEPSLQPGLAFFSAGFEPTTTLQQVANFGVSGVVGVTATLSPSGSPYLAAGGTSLGFPGSPFGSIFYNNDDFWAVSWEDKTVGAWFFRPVPAPASHALLGAALLGVLATRRRRRFAPVNPGSR